MIRAALITVAVVALCACAGYGASRALTPPAPQSRELQVEQRLMCPVCSQTRLDVCDQPVCQDMKTDVRARLAGGESPDSIVASYQQAYGPSILATPPPGPADAVPWVALLALLSAVGAAVLAR